MSIVDLESRLRRLAEVLAELGLGRYDLDITAGDDALGVVEHGVNGLMLDLETLHLANEEKAAYLELQQRALDGKEELLREKSAALAEQMATIAEQRALLDTREREVAAMLAKIERQSEALRELSVPVIEVEDGIVALPVIGAIDAERAQEIMQTLLEHVVTTRSRRVILDLTGVTLIDTQTADYIHKVVRAVDLVGARCVVSGLNPVTAQTLVDLGVDLGAIRTFRNLKEALRDSLRAAAQARRTNPR
jgi:anti-anti-sigma regulatory factor